MVHLPTFGIFGVAIVSFVGLVLAIRGRKLLTPNACYRCRFDIASVIAAGRSGKKCPECGSALDNPQAARSFRRRRCWKLAAPCFILLVPSLWILGVRSVAGYQAANWWAYAPTSMLCWAIENIDGRQLDGAARAAVARFDDEIAAKRTDIPRRLEAAAMARHKSAKAWCPVLGTVIHSAYDNDLITAKEATDFVRRGWTISLHPLQGYFPGSLLWDLNVTCVRGEGQSRFVLSLPSPTRSHKLTAAHSTLRLVGVKFRGRDLPLVTPDPLATKWMGDRSFYGGINGSEGNGMTWPDGVSVPKIDDSGDLEVTYEITIGDEHWTQVEKGTGYTVAAQPHPLVPGGAPEKLAEKMRASFSAKAIIYSNTPEGDAIVTITPSADLSMLPMPICFGVELSPAAPHHYDEGAYPYLFQPTPAMRNQDWFPTEFVLPKGRDEKTVDVVIQPRLEVRAIQLDQIDALLKSGQTLKVWDEPIVIRNVPIEDHRVAPKP